MNILILNWKDIKHPQVGGAEIIVYELAKLLVAQGNQVTWFCRSFKGGPSEEVSEGIKVVRRGNLLTMYLHAPIYYWSLKQKPDLVIDISNTIYWQTPLWAFKSKKIAYLNQLAQDVFYYEYPLIVSRLGIFFEKLQYLSYRKTPFVCYAKSTKDDLISMGIPPKNIDIFPLGVDHLRYFPGKKSNSPLFICVNRLVKMKRTDLAIEAMSIVRLTHPEARLMIVGTGYDRPRLQALRDKLHLESIVNFVDEDVWFFSKTAKDVKVKLMQQAWALIFPSVKEGWGMTVTECAACGTPSIVSNVAGLRDSVINNKTGIVVSSNPGPPVLAGAINSLIENPQTRKRLSQGAIKFAKEFSWDKCHKELYKIITKLI